MSGDLYSKLYAASHAYVTVNDITPSNPFTSSRVADLLAVRTPDAVHSWGHALFVEKSPYVPSGKLDNAAFTAHLKDNLFAALQGLRCEVKNIFVDTKELKTVVLSSYSLQAKGSEVVVENDLVWALWFKEDNGKLKVSESIEYMDPVAVQAIGEEVSKQKGQ